MPGLARLIRRLYSDQRGQDAIEFGGVLLVVALIVAAVVALASQSLGSTVARDIVCLVEKIVGQQGCAPGPAYTVSTSVKTVGYNGRAGIVDGSHGYTITLTKLSDGSSTISVTNTGKLGVSAQVGAGVELGPLGSADAEASIGGGGYGDQVNTWTFPSWSQGQSYYNKISQGSALGLGAHDVVSSTAGSFPIVGGLATGLFDKITGASGAPSSGSLPHQYLTSSSTGGGIQGSGDAKAGVDFGPLSAGVGASLDAHAGIEHLNYGPEKGDWQLVAGLDGTADGSLAGGLFGPEASGAGNITGELGVTFSPSGTPEKLEVVATGDGVWDVGISQDAKVEVPGGSSGEGGTSKEGGSGEGGKEPVLSVETGTSGGSGVGSSFSGTLDLSNDPQAEQDVESILQGNTSKIPDLIDQMNSQGTETVQTYHITRSSTSFGAKASFGVGFGGGLNDGSSTATYDPPETRDHGGKWHKASH